MDNLDPLLDKAVFRELIAKNQNEKVIEALIQVAKKIENKDISNSIILLSNKFENYIRDSRDGVLSQEQQEVSLSKLNGAILNLIDDIPEESFHLIKGAASQQPAAPTEAQAEDKLMKYMILSLFGLGLLGLVASFIYLAIKFMPTDAPEFAMTDLILLIGSLTAIFTGGLFYTINKR